MSNITNPFFIYHFSTFPIYDFIHSKPSPEIEIQTVLFLFQIYHLPYLNQHTEQNNEKRQLVETPPNLHIILMRNFRMTSTVYLPDTVRCLSIGQNEVLLQALGIGQALSSIHLQNILSSICRMNDIHFIRHCP